MFTKEQLLAEKARRQQSQSSESSFTKEQLIAEKQRRQGVASAAPQPKVSSDLKIDEPVDFDAGTMVSNIPSSGVQYLKDMVEPFLSPIETAKSVGRLGLGVAQKVVPQIYNERNGLDPEDAKIADAVGQAMTDRYGGMDEIKNTAMNDPVGMLSDVVGIVSMGGSLVPKYGSKISKAANAADPVNMVLNSGKVLADKVTPDSLPNNLYKRSTKFSTKLSDGERTDITQTALDEGISPTSDGLEKLDKIVGEEGAKVGALLDAAESAGESVPKVKLLFNLRKEINKMDKMSTPEFETRKAQMVDVLNSFGRQWKDSKTLSPNQVQELKLGLDEVINYNRRNQSGKFAKENAQKIMRRGAKDALEDMSAGIGEANSRMSKLKALKDGGLEQSANRIANNNLLGIQTPIAAIVGGQVGGAIGSPELGAVAGAGVSKLTSGTAQADMAIALNAIKKSPLKDIYFDGNGQLTEIGRQAILQLGRLNQESTEESQLQQTRQ